MTLSHRPRGTEIRIVRHAGRLAIVCSLLGCEVSGNSKSEAAGGSTSTGGVLTSKTTAAGGSSASGGHLTTGGALSSGGRLTTEASPPASGGEVSYGGEYAYGGERPWFVEVGGAGGQSGDLEAQSQREQEVLAAWQTQEAQPVDTRQEPPPWNAPPFVTASSPTPYCSAFEIEPEDKGLHADSRGLFLAVARSCPQVLDAHSPCDEVEGSAIYQYSQGAWSVLARPSLRIAPMVGVPEGPLFIGADVVLDPDQSFQVLRNPYLSETTFGSSTVIRTGSEAYLVYRSVNEEGAPLALAQFDGDAWVRRLTAKPGGKCLGGDDNGTLYFSSSIGLVAGKPPNLESLGQDASSTFEVVAKSPEDFWFINYSNVEHYEHGVLTAQHELYPGAVMWSETRAYGLLDHTFGYLSNDGWVVLAETDNEDLAAPYFTDLAVVSDTEIYLTMHDPALSNHRCGATIVLKYNGTTFARI